MESNTYKKNTAAQRIVVTEFGTKACPDPCKTIFHRYVSKLRIHNIYYCYFILITHFSIGNICCRSLIDKTFENNKFNLMSLPSNIYLYYNTCMFNYSRI